MNASAKKVSSEELVSAERNADRTRADLLIAAEREMHLRGFQAASLSKILNDAGMTKGALYHHFSNKKALGYAVIDEVWGPLLSTMWLNPLRDETSNPIDLISKIIEDAASAMTDDELILGCPLNNIAQEMSPIDEGFRDRINALLAQWRHGIGQALLRGQQQGVVSNRIPAEAAAAMIVASLEGCIGMAKNAQSKDLLAQCGMGVIDYLDTLRS